MTDNILEIKFNDQDYPPLLREIDQPPVLLYVRGNPKVLCSNPMLAVVGSRRGNIYGQQAIQQLLTPIVLHQVPLVSGMAFGIDSMAHRLCLSKNQPTIAVLGSGVDDPSIYPRTNLKLAHQIIVGGGAIISEYKPGTPPHLGQFPARNRIIAGLTKATIVIQAKQRSGSLITARLALESGRDVAAVPGKIDDPLSGGTNQLIRDGAAPLTEAADIFTLLNIDSPAAATQQLQLPALSHEQQAIFHILTSDPQHIDIIVQKTNLSINAASIALMELEMASLIANIGSMKYVKT